jgi:O-antigen ligase
MIATPAPTLRPAERLLQISLGIAPLGLLFLRHWFEACFTLASLAALWLLATPRLDHQSSEPTNTRWLKPLLITFCGPVLAILISQTIRDDFDWPYYDAPSRFIFAIPILLVLMKRPIRVLPLLEATIPLSLILTAITWHWLPKTGWAADPNRWATYFVDPLSFGRLSLELGLLSVLMLGIHPATGYKWIMHAIKITAFILGIAFSIQSQSRTGWLALPLVFYFLMVTNLPLKRIYAHLLATLLMVSVAAMWA